MNRAISLTSQGDQHICTRLSIGKHSGATESLASPSIWWSHAVLQPQTPLPPLSGGRGRVGGTT